MLTLEGLEYARGEFTLAADFAVSAGARVAVIGPSGGGKSTLLGLIAGFLQPANGRILWDGSDMAGMMPGARPVSILFQDNNLFPHLTVAQNVGLGLRADLRLTGAQKAQVEAALARVDLAGFGARKPAALSGGQVSRVALARMLLRAKPLLLLDEPFAALGPALRDEMLDLVTELATETKVTLMMVSHNPEDAKRIASNVVLVSDGVANSPVNTAAIFADPPEALRRYLG